MRQLALHQRIETWSKRAHRGAVIAHTVWQPLLKGKSSCASFGSVCSKASGSLEDIAGANSSMKFVRTELQTRRFGSQSSDRSSTTDSCPAMTLLAAVDKLSEDPPNYRVKRSTF
jgi:hypothetical protein